jgi:hypothetical protein
MQMKTLIVIGWALIFVLSKEGGDCDEKAILDRNKLIYTSYGDTKIAYNHASSCVSLKSADNHACCYLKVKFKNSVSDKKYTHRGCIQVSLNEWQNIDDLIDRLENNITTTDRNVTLEKKDVHIDCNSNYIKLAGLLIFALLL